MEKVTQREYFNYKDNAIGATKKNKETEEITHLLINNKNNQDNSYQLGN